MAWQGWGTRGPGKGQTGNPAPCGKKLGLEMVFSRPLAGDGGGLEALASSTPQAPGTSTTGGALPQRGVSIPSPQALTHSCYGHHSLSYTAPLGRGFGSQALSPLPTVLGCGCLQAFYPRLCRLSTVRPSPRGLHVPLPTFPGQDPGPTRPLSTPFLLQ